MLIRIMSAVLGGAMVFSGLSTFRDPDAMAQRFANPYHVMGAKWLADVRYWRPLMIPMGVICVLIGGSLIVTALIGT
jgi:hypothetical protein